MPFCPNCGTATDGQYCPKCGTTLDPSAPRAEPNQPVSAAGLPENVAAALCYVLGFITGIIFLVLAPYNRNKTIRFHAFQSIFLNVAAFLIVWALGFAFTGFAWHLVPLVNLAFFVLWVYMIVQTYQGKKIVLPLIGDAAAKQA
jgi:uncharacterized membrane protein